MTFPRRHRVNLFTPILIPTRYAMRGERFPLTTETTDDEPAPPGPNHVTL